MKAFINGFLVFNLIVALVFVSQLESVGQFARVAQKDSSMVDLSNSAFDLNDPYNHFLFVVCSSLSMADEAKGLREFLKLKEQFPVCKINQERLLLVSDALRIIKELAISEKISENKKLRLGFVLFVKRELPSFGFEGDYIDQFIKGLKWDGDYNLLLLKSQLKGKKFVRIISDNSWNAVKILAAINTIGAFFLNRNLKDDGLGLTVCKNVRAFIYSFGLKIIKLRG